jgi:hypothetical protein
MLSKEFDYEELDEEEKKAYIDMYPNEDINEEWDIVKHDYIQRSKEYQSSIITIESISMYNDGKMSTIPIKSDFIHENFPKLLSNVIQEGVKPSFSYITDYIKDAEIIDVISLLGLKTILFYKYGNDEDGIINMKALKDDLKMNKLLFRISNNIENEIENFEFMNELLGEIQGGEEYGWYPYNLGCAFFATFYYMRENVLALRIIKSMEMIIGSYNGLVRGEDVLKSSKILSFKFNNLREKIKFRNFEHINIGFPCLLDMKSSSYSIKVLENDDEFIITKPRFFAMNKITYYDFNEKYRKHNPDYVIYTPFVGYYETMIFIFKLLIPDEENFILAKSIGFIDSRKINWQYWKEKVIKHKIENHRQMKMEHMLILMKVKKNYYNFINNLINDYRKKTVNDPVGLVFNIAAIVFAVAGIIQVLQAANIIPTKS